MDSEGLRFIKTFVQRELDTGKVVRVPITSRITLSDINEAIKYYSNRQYLAKIKEDALLIWDGKMWKGGRGLCLVEAGPAEKHKRGF